MVKCEICNEKDLNVFVRGRTRNSDTSEFTDMCMRCFDTNGKGLGKGFGKIYSWNPIRKEYDEADPRMWAGE